MRQHDEHPSPLGTRWQIQGLLPDFQMPDIVTVQLNVTMDFATKSYKHVCIVRDPIAQAELARYGTRERNLDQCITDVGGTVMDLWDLLQTWYPDSRL